MGAPAEWSGRGEVELDEPMLEEAAAQVLLELTHDEFGQPTVLLGSLEEARPVRVRTRAGEACRPQADALHLLGGGT